MRRQASSTPARTAIPFEDSDRQGAWGMQKRGPIHFQNPLMRLLAGLDSLPHGLL